jgi:hypothetical protein
MLPKDIVAPTPSYVESSLLTEDYRGTRSGVVLFVGYRAILLTSSSCSGDLLGSPGFSFFLVLRHPLLGHLS